MGVGRGWQLRVLSGAVLAAVVIASAAWAAGDAATKSAPDVADHATRLILLGTGAGPIPRKLRSQPASLLVVDGRPYLIDAGNGVARQLVWAGFQPADVRTIFI